MVFSVSLCETHASSYFVGRRFVLWSFCLDGAQAGRLARALEYTCLRGVSCCVGMAW